MTAQIVGGRSRIKHLRLNNFRPVRIINGEGQSKLADHNFVVVIQVLFVTQQRTVEPGAIGTLFIFEEVTKTTAMNFGMKTGDGCINDPDLIDLFTTYSGPVGSYRYFLNQVSLLLSRIFAINLLQYSLF